MVGTAQAASASAPTTPPPVVKRAHLGLSLPGPDRMPAALPAKFASKLQAMSTRLTPNVGGGTAFITRPYMNYHPATSIFDHCNPDYSVDGRLCEYDGTVALASNGSDPGFSKGYAVTPGGGDYLYYDGHNGWDLALNYENVMAAADGVVRIAGIDSVNPCFGNNVVIDHPNGMSTRYAHLNQIYVSVGASVYRGQVIGQSGNSGCSTGPHLHFGVYITSSWTAIDPFGWTGAPGADPWPSDQGDLWLTGLPANPVPLAPTGVTAVAGYQSATVSWQPPAFDGGSGVSYYVITASPGGNTATASGSATSATVSGLTTGTSYTFTVSAINNVAASPASAPSNAVIPFAVPSQPLNVTASPGNLSATVSWSPPAIIGGSPVSGYTVASTTGGISLNVPASPTQVTIPNLAASASYQFTVAASNAAGTGPASASSNAVTPYPFAAMYTLDGFGALHSDGTTPAATVTGYWPNWKIAQAAVMLPDNSGGYVLDGFGGLHPFKVGNNSMPANVVGAPYWGWNIARDVVLLPGSTAAQPQGYVLDGSGGVHQFGGAPVARATAYWQGLDIAKRIVLLGDSSGGYVMDSYGALHPFAVGNNPMPPSITNNAYWPNWSIASDAALLPGSTASTVGGVTLDGFGGVHGFGSVGAVTGFAYWNGWSIARSVRLSPASTAAHAQGWTLDGFGGVHAFGGAPSVPMSAYWNWDIAVDLMVN